MVRIALLLAALVAVPEIVQADSAYFRGTRTGWGLTEQVFADGYYKEHDLLLVIGARPTATALETIRSWKSRTTYLEDLSAGVDTFGEQLTRSGRSIPANSADLGGSVADLFVDPVREISDLNLLTPASLIFKTAVNVVKIGWYGAMVVGEPVARTTYGTAALVGAPLVKPVTYAGVALAYSGTAVYGYGSSVAAGTVMTAATGAVLALDVATTPAVAVYGAFRPDTGSSAETVAPEIR